MSLYLNTSFRKINKSLGEGTKGEVRQINPRQGGEQFQMQFDDHSQQPATCTFHTLVHQISICRMQNWATFPIMNTTKTCFWKNVSKCATMWKTGIELISSTSYQVEACYYDQSFLIHHHVIKVLLCFERTRNKSTSVCPVKVECSFYFYGDLLTTQNTRISFNLHALFTFSKLQMN